MAAPPPRPPAAAGRGGGALGSGAALHAALDQLGRAEEADRSAHARLRAELASERQRAEAAEARASEAIGVAVAARAAADAAGRQRDAALAAAAELEARLQARRCLRRRAWTHMPVARRAARCGAARCFSFAPRNPSAHSLSHAFVRAPTPRRCQAAEAEVDGLAEQLADMFGAGGGAVPPPAEAPATRHAHGGSGAGGGNGNIGGAASSAEAREARELLARLTHAMDEHKQLTHAAAGMQQARQRALLRALPLARPRMFMR
jgi:hypothetical protein